MDYVKQLEERIEDNPVPMAVVDYCGMRDADGLVRAADPVDRRFGVRDMRHVAIYKLTVVSLNKAAREQKA